jgi:hypothetical protein
MCTIAHGVRDVVYAGLRHRRMEGFTPTSHLHLRAQPHAAAKEGGHCMVAVLDSVV